MINGNINYKWAIFNSYVKSPEGNGSHSAQCMPMKTQIAKHATIMVSINMFPCNNCFRFGRGNNFSSQAPNRFRSQARQDAVKITSPMLGNSDLCTPTWHRPSSHIWLHQTPMTSYDSVSCNFLISKLGRSRITSYYIYNYIKKYIYN